jgi:hypothetical protein
MLPADFCNCTYDVRADSPSSRFLAGTMAMTTFLFLRIRRTPTSFTREALTRGEPRMRPNNRDPGAGSSCLRRFARPRYLDCRATLVLIFRRLAPPGIFPSACAAGPTSCPAGERAK